MVTVKSLTIREQGIQKENQTEYRPKGQKTRLIKGSQMSLESTQKTLNVGFNGLTMYK